VELVTLPNNETIWLNDRSEVEFLYKEIFESQCYLPSPIHVDASSVVFDVGANIGLASVFFAKVLNVAAVFAYEPAPASFDTLEANFRLHKIKGAAFQYALSDTSGTTKFTHYPHASAKSGIYADYAADSSASRAYLRREGFDDDDIAWLLKRKFTAETLLVQRRTLSEALADTAVTQIDLLKIDAEKSEQDVLAGVSDEHWHAGTIRQLVVEVHDIGGRLSYLREMLAAHGYQLDVRESVSPCSESHILSARLAA